MTQYAKPLCMRCVARPRSCWRLSGPTGCKPALAGTTLEQLHLELQTLETVAAFLSNMDDQNSCSADLQTLFFPQHKPICPFQMLPIWSGALR